MRRREFIKLVGAATASYPLTARAHPDMRRIAVLMGWSDSNQQFRSLFDKFVQELARLGWADGRNLQIYVRWTGGDVTRTQTFAKELVELQPDVIFASTTPVMTALQRETHTIPIVFVIVADPVSAGFVSSLPRPGGNITGFSNVVTTLGGKWLEILKEMVPGLKRVAMMFNPDTAPSGAAYLVDSFQAAARSLAVEPVTAHVHSDAEIEAEIVSLGQEKAGLALMTDAFLVVHQATVIAVSTRNNVPVIGADFPSFAKEGGLLSYGADFPDIFRRAAEYVDRILHGEKPADLAVQQPNKFDLIINLKTAKALGLTVPTSLLVSAAEIIE
jgi:putative tryptophan/tyrosine transport system substrate-binding protein